MHSPVFKVSRECIGHMRGNDHNVQWFEWPAVHVASSGGVLAI